MAATSSFVLPTYQRVDVISFLHWIPLKVCPRWFANLETWHKKLTEISLVTLNLIVINNLITNFILGNVF